MRSAKLADRLEVLLEPEAASRGFELVAVEQAGGRGVPVVRVLLDREGGIDLQALTSANRWVSEVLDACEPITGPYTLEVSSPGIDRPLRKPADFSRFVGEKAVVKTRTPGGRHSFTGAIVEADDLAVTLDVDGDIHRIAYDDITKARLKGVVDFGREGSATR